MFKQFLALVDTATLCMRFLSVAPNKYPGVPGPTKPHLATLSRDSPFGFGVVPAVIDVRHRSSPYLLADLCYSSPFLIHSASVHQLY